MRSKQANGDLLAQDAFQTTDERGQGHAQRVANLSNLEDIETPLATLVLAHKRLMPTENPGDVDLTCASFDPKIPENRLDDLSIRARSPFAHGGHCVSRFCCIPRWDDTLRPDTYDQIRSGPSICDRTGE